MATVYLPAFRKQVQQSKRRLRNFLTRFEKKLPRNVQTFVVELNEQVWKETDCLHCANCCKTMSPTYTKQDMQRISQHLGMTEKAFRDKWLYKDRTGDWMNTSQPCQFLDLKTNMCHIYAVRPADCAGFPHHAKKVKDYAHVLKQNVEFCPATFRLVEKMMDRFRAG